MRDPLLLRLQRRSSTGLRALGTSLAPSQQPCRAELSTIPLHSAAIGGGSKECWLGSLGLSWLAPLTAPWEQLPALRCAARSSSSYLLGSRRRGAEQRLLLLLLLLREFLLLLLRRIGHLRPAAPPDDISDAAGDRHGRAQQRDLPQAARHHGQARPALPSPSPAELRVKEGGGATACRGRGSALPSNWHGDGQGGAWRSGRTCCCCDDFS